MQEKLERLLAILYAASKALLPYATAGDRRADIVRDNINLGITRLNQIDFANPDLLDLGSRMLDVLPDSKDMDAVGFIRTNYPDFDALLREAEDVAGDIAADVVQSL